MDTLRGTFGAGDPGDAASLDDTFDDAASPAATAPRQNAPQGIGQDERRMQVRAYNHWASQLDDRAFPLIEELEPANLPDFGPYSALIDFTSGIEDPAVQFLGEKLAAECGSTGPIDRLSDVPPRSLLSRITDHYLQILANQAPIGFEAEFINQRGASTLYRGILLPYSSDGETIDFLYGVINWKEIADQVAADELLLEIDQALDLVSEIDDEDDMDLPVQPIRRVPEALATWADSPASEAAGDSADMPSALSDFANISPLGDDRCEQGPGDDLPVPDFGAAGFSAGDFDDSDFSHYALDDDFDEGEDAEEDDTASYSFASLADYIEAPQPKRAIDPAAFELDETLGGEDPRDDVGEDPAYPEIANDYDAAPAQILVADEFADADDEEHIEASGIMAANDTELTSLHDCLAAARDLAHAAHSTEDRSRAALYAAVSRAYDFSLAAQEQPEDYALLVADSGLTIQERAPMTPVVKLVFGADYDKTRLTEYAAVLSHAHRLQLERGSLAAFLCNVEGGLKAIVKAERRLRRGDTGEVVEQAGAVREALAQQLRELEAMTLEALDGGGAEFALVLVRRDEVGCVEILGELPEDVPQIERAAKKLIG